MRQLTSDASVGFRPMRVNPAWNVLREDGSDSIHMAYDYAVESGYTEIAVLLAP